MSRAYPRDSKLATRKPRWACYDPVFSMATCFVIQPFDGGPFDKRYADVFVPAITEAGLEAYRVDQDPAAAIPIEQIVALATVAENVDDPEAAVSTWSIRQDMEKSGYTRIATTLGLASLLKKGMVESERRQNQDGEDFAVYRVTQRGMQWLLANQERLVLRREKRSESSPLTDDDIPF